MTMTNRAGNYGTPNFSPSQNMINKFETINGYLCELTREGWKCDDPAFNPNKPFLNRDPRLEHFILLPGELFGMRQTNPFYLSTWAGGLDNSIQGSATEGGRGDILSKYLCKKYMWPATVKGNNAGSNYSDNTFSTSIIRTTQVWLDYAEAMNEAYGPDTKPSGYNWTALEAVNLVRERVGQQPVRSEYTGTKEALRERIRNERAVELFCENHRWFDIRRWMIAEQLFTGDANPIKGITVQIKPGYTSSNPQLFPPGATDAERNEAKYGECFTYTLNNIIEEVRIFERRHYWYPMRRSEVNQFPAFKQNPGW
jgi:hypothetical protein